MKRRSGEHDLQEGCVRWFRMQYRGEVIFAIPNGGKRDKVTARRMRDEGVTSGVPDLMIAAVRGGYGGLFVEMKNGSAGRVSEEQMEMMERLRKAGYRCEVVRSFEEFVSVVRTYFYS